MTISELQFENMRLRSENKRLKNGEKTFIRLAICLLITLFVCSLIILGYAN